MPDAPDAELDDTINPAAVASPAARAKAVPTSHPIAFWFFFWGEFAERCSFYGMKSIFFFYMTERLGFENGTASTTVNYFKAACYFLPLLGGFVADRYFGKYLTIVAFSLPYILGHVIIGFESVPCVMISLVLLSMGAGVIKPNISTLMGLTYDQQRPGQTQLRSDAFGMFYVAINTGAFVSSFAVPLIRNAYNYQIAFLFPALLMVISFALFAAGKPFYARETIHREPPTPQTRREQWRVLRKLFGLFSVVIFFWSVLEQYDNTWILFAKDHIDLDIFNFRPGTWQAGILAFVRDWLHVDLAGKPIVADQFQSLNAILVMVLVPTGALVWRFLDKAGWRLRPTDKMFIGFLLTFATPLILTVAAALAGDQGRVSAWWIVAAYVTVTAAEICISVVCLELAFTAAPNSMKGFVTACWLLTLSFGDVFNAKVTPYYDSTVPLAGRMVHITPAIYFGLFTLFLIPVTIAFTIVARRFNNVQSNDAIVAAVP